MKNILAAGHRGVLERFLEREKTLVGFDYDGTLAPLVAKRERAKLRATTRRLFVRLAGERPCAVISGRARASVGGFLTGVPVRAIIGNHGAEWPGARARAQQAEFRARARIWKRALRAQFAAADACEGVEIEDKGVSLAVHYRAVVAGDKRRALRAIEKAARGLQGCRVVTGIDVVNLVPHEALDKGQALLRLLEESGCSSAIYIGDDVTDEDVFALEGRTDRVLGIRVGRAGKTRARWFVPEQRNIDDLLRLMVGVSAGVRKPGGRG